MKTKNLQSLALQKTTITRLTTQQLTGGATTTHHSNITCGGLCADSGPIVCGIK
ncbi:MAG: class I lanthipeptide [Bacteroidota bacterium]